MPAEFPWTIDVEERVCDDIASGMSIREVAAQTGMPSEATIYRKLAKDERFAGMMANARAAQQDSEIEKCVELADAATPEDWQVVKLRIWARQWRASKLAPKKYGDKQNIELSGGTKDQLRVVSEFDEPGADLV